MTEMALKAFMDVNLISKVTITFFFEGCLLSELVRFFRIIKKAANAAFS